MTIDLRTFDAAGILDRVSHALNARLIPVSEQRKRRSLGYLTHRHTWVRIETRPLASLPSQGWNGTEAAAVLNDIAKPKWLQGVAWHDTDSGLAWRADETDYVTSPPVKHHGLMRCNPDLSDGWWRTLNKSLDALAAQPTSRVATPEGDLLTQARITATITAAYPNVDTFVDEWTTAHGDLYWSNVTGPACHLIDWEGWGRAPRGWDASYLWIEALPFPDLAARVYDERRADLNSPSGIRSRLYQCAKFITAPPGYAGRLLEPAQQAARAIVADLRD